MYLERMERILAEVQATHTDLISRRSRRTLSRQTPEKEGPSPHHRHQYLQQTTPTNVETVPLDIDEILADASIETPDQGRRSPVGMTSPPRRLREILESNNVSPVPSSAKTPPVSGLKKRNWGRGGRLDFDTRIGTGASPSKNGEEESPSIIINNSNVSVNVVSSNSKGLRPSSAARRSSALKKLRKVSARNRSVRQSSSYGRSASVSGGQKPLERRRSKKKQEDEKEGVIAVTSSTFCLNHQHQEAGGQAGGNESHISQAVRETAANMAEVLLVDGIGMHKAQAQGGEDQASLEQIRERVLRALDGMEAKTKEALAANLRRALVRRRLKSKLGRSVIADIKHLTALIQGFNDKGSSSSFQNRQLEEKMRVQFMRDLTLKKKELIKVLSTSQSLAPRVLRKPAVPVTPLKRVSKSLRIRNRPDTAPASGAWKSRNTRVEAKDSTTGASGTSEAGARKSARAWGNGAEEKNLDAKKSKSVAQGTSSSTSPELEIEATSKEGGSVQKINDAAKADSKKVFLKRKRQKVKMYKIPNYSHVKPLVNSHHNDEQEDDPEGYMYTEARPATAPATNDRGKVSLDQVDSPIDDLKEILGLKHLQGKENAFPRRKGRRRKSSSVNSSMHLNISGTVTRLFSSSVQKAKDSILLFEQSHAENNWSETSNVPNALQQFAAEEEPVSRSTRSIAPGLLEKIKHASEELEDFVVPRKLSFVHLHSMDKASS